MDVKKFIFMMLLWPIIIKAADNPPVECTVKKPYVTVTAFPALFTVRLPSNPTTGYRWFLRDVPANLKPLGMSYKTSKKSQLIGEGRDEIWRFRVSPIKVPRQFKVLFVYARPFEQHSVDKFSCQIYVLP